MAQSMLRNPRLRLVLWSLVILLLAAIGFAQARPYLWPPARVLGMTGKPFSLQSTEGTRFTESSLNGVPSLLFFGYSSCPDACPTTLASLSAYREQLKLAPADLRIVFATVDPARDTIPVLKTYLAGFGTPIIGLSGTTDEVEAAKTAFGVYSKKGPDDGSGSYSVDHTATVYLLDKQGAFESTITFGEESKVAMEKIKRLVGS